MSEPFRLKKREDRMLLPEEGAALRAQIARLKALLNDKTYIRCKADYNRGHLSHANYLDSMEVGLGLDDGQSTGE